MAIKWISYIWDKTDYRDGSALVALALADFANEEGTCHPKMETVAKKSRLSVRQVQRIIKGFEVDGFLEIVRNYGRGKEPVFQLKKVASVTPFKDRKKVTSVTLKGDICDIKKVTSVTLPLNKEEPLIEPLMNRENTPRESQEKTESKTPPYQPTSQTENSLAAFESLADGIVGATENALGIRLDQPVQSRIMKVIAPTAEHDWLEMVRNRGSGLSGLSKQQMNAKIGYWLDDFMRYKKPAEQQTTPKKWAH